MKSKKLFVLSLILALLAAGAVYRYLGELERMTRASANLVPVLVPKENIPARTRLSESMFAVVDVPKDFRHAEAIVEMGAIRGAFARETLIAGEQVLSSRLVYSQGNNALSYRVSPGHRALTLSVGTVSGVAGFILPGDRVDVVLTMDMESGATGENVVTTVIATGLRVLAAGQFTSEQNKEQLVVDSVTLDVPVEQVTKLVQASEKGAVRLVLRPADEEGGKIAPAHYPWQFTPTRDRL